MNERALLRQMFDAAYEAASPDHASSFVCHFASPSSQALLQCPHLTSRVDRRLFTL